MPTPHKHAEVIKAWADGAQIQFKVPGSPIWENFKVGVIPYWNENTKFRVKPASKEYKYRLYLWRNFDGEVGISVLNRIEHVELIVKNSSFIKWLGPWQTHTEEE